MNFLENEKFVFNLSDIQLLEKMNSDQSKYFPADTGYLIFTHKRIAFFGKKTSLEIPLDKIQTLNSLNDVLELSDSNNKNLVCFSGLGKVQTFFISVYITIAARPRFDFLKN
jgi:hypothetical protein